MCSQNRASVVCLQETKLSAVDRPLILDLLGSEFADSFCFLPADGMRGGIILAFSADHFTITNSSSSTNTISASVSMRASLASWSISVVYGPQADADKFEFISELKDLKASMLAPWILLGDFNLLCRVGDKSSGTVNRRLINSFRAALNVLEVDELRLHGRRFTWASTCHQQTQTKIDHVFCTTDWSLLFPQCHLRAASTSISDHCAMILTGQVSQSSYKGFRFENYWLKIRDFREAVIDSWQAPVTHSDAMWRLNFKLSRLARALRRWSRSRVGNIALLSTIAEQVILALDFAQDARDLTIAELGLRLFLRQKLLGLAAVQCIRIRQRSRILWLSPNHAKSKLFHIKANGRRRRNFIPMLETDSGQLTLQSDKQAEFLRHFKSSIGTAPARHRSFNWASLGIPSVDLSALKGEFSEPEIKATVFNLPSGKAPGPDGFTADFFKSCWDIVKADLIATLNQVFSLRAKRWKFLNQAFITLLPKSADASRVKDFRPISLIHSVAKILCKLLANRLAPFLQQLVPCSQSAFIKTRSIHDNFLYVKNAVRSLHKSKSAALLLKLDIAGAFDSVSWGYMFELMTVMGFGPRWRNLMAVLWSSASSRVMVNGELGLNLFHMQGLRQGDPLSPMLFAIAIAPLH